MEIILSLILGAAIAVSGGALWQRFAGFAAQRRSTTPKARLSSTSASICPDRSCARA
jgi:hypothetical protein